MRSISGKYRKALRYLTVKTPIANMKLPNLNKHPVLTISILVSLGVLAAGAFLQNQVRAEEKQSDGESIAFDPTVWNSGLKQGRSIEALVRANNTHAIVARFNTAMAQTVTEDQVSQILQDTSSQAPLGERLGESVRTDSSGYITYEAELSWNKAVELLQVTFDNDGKIAGLIIKDQDALPPDPHAAYTTKGTFLLPFEGTWFVFWGGNTDINNYHVVAPDQRHAYDIVMAKDGSTYHDSPDDVTHYYAFGQHILSPIDATVVEAVDGVPDNKPGVMNTDQVAGNHVILNCGNGEYLLMAHFKNHSLKVHAGDKVIAGQYIAQCGNSGNTSEPHLHIHLQDGPTLFQAKGMPLEFSSFTANGQGIDKGELVQGQFIKSTK